MKNVEKKYNPQKIQDWVKQWAWLRTSSCQIHRNSISHRENSWILTNCSCLPGKVTFLPSSKNRKISGFQKAASRQCKWQCQRWNARNEQQHYCCYHSADSDRGIFQLLFKAEARCSFITTTVREQHPRSHHKGATGRVRTGNQLYPVLWDCQLGQDIPFTHQDLGHALHMEI